MDIDGARVLVAGASDQLKPMDTLINQYPRAAVPLAPVLSWHSAQFRRTGEKPPSILDCRYALQLTSGRAAIALALQHAGVSRGDEVLIPAFHCESMVAPCNWLKAKPVFYRINPDSSIDIDDIAARISPDTKALIVTHYFGFLQNLPPVAKLCSDNGIKLIEDCAHAFFGSIEGRRVGSQGDYAIASSMKFFPVLDGGLLASNTVDIRALPLQPTAPFFQIKSIMNTIESTLDYGRLGLPGKVVGLLLNIKEFIWSGIKKLLGDSGDVIDAPSSSQGGQELNEAWIQKRASLASRTIVEFADLQRICTLRRTNYERLDKALRSLPGCHPLHDTLPDNCVPLVYPLYVEEAATLFPLIKQRAIPIWRFGEYLDERVTREVCENSVKLSAHIFQFPCHQELQDHEIEWIIESVTSTVSGLNPGGY